MGVVIREVNFDHEMPLLRDTFNANFRLKGSIERFQWLYFDNPDGVATAWFAIDERTGAIAGCTAVIPRRVRLKGSRRVLTGWTCSDFCINPQHRTMGVAIKLRRVARDAVAAGAVPFLYAHPNDRMLQVHLRVGHVPLGTMLRLAKPLRPRRQTWLLRKLGALALRAAGRDCWLRRTYELEVGSGTLPRDIGAIYERAAESLGTSIVRDYAYLQWRFGNNPVERHYVLVVRSAGEPRGYAAVTLNDGVAMLKDWLAVSAEAREQLFVALITWCRGMDATSISVIALESHPDLRVLRWFGFVRRPEQSTVITYASEAVPGAREIGSLTSWYMTAGDRDV